MLILKISHWLCYLVQICCFCYRMLILEILCWFMQIFFNAFFGFVMWGWWFCIVNLSCRSEYVVIIRHWFYDPVITLFFDADFGHFKANLLSDADFEAIWLFFYQMLILEVHFVNVIWCWFRFKITFSC